VGLSLYSRDFGSVLRNIGLGNETSTWNEDDLDKNKDLDFRPQ